MTGSSNQLNIKVPISKFLLVVSQVDSRGLEEKNDGLMVYDRSHQLLSGQPSPTPPTACSFSGPPLQGFMDFQDPTSLATPRERAGNGSKRGL